MIYQVPMIITDEYKHIAYGPCKVLSVHGFNANTGAGSDRFLQFHTKFPAALANGNVPTFKSLWFPSGAESVYGRETFGDAGLSFSELLAAVSSTGPAYTAVTDTGLDITIVVDTECYMDTGFTVAGDLTTGRDELEVWTQATGGGRLLRLDFNNDTAGTVWPLIVAEDTPLATSHAQVLAPVAASASKTYFFGPGGGQIVGRVGANIVRGCRIVWGDGSGGVLTVPYNFPGTTNCDIRVVYV